MRISIFFLSFIIFGLFLTKNTSLAFLPGDCRNGGGDACSSGYECINGVCVQNTPSCSCGPNDCLSTCSTSSCWNGCMNCPGKQTCVSATNTPIPTSCTGNCNCADSTNVGSQCWNGCDGYCSGRYIPPTATPTNTPTPVSNPCTNANGTCFTTTSCDSLSPPKESMTQSCNDSNKQCCGDNLTTCSAIGGNCYGLHGAQSDCFDLGRVDKSSGSGCGGSQICCGGALPPTSTPVSNATPTPVTVTNTPAPNNGEVCGNNQCLPPESSCKVDNSNIGSCCLRDCGWTTIGVTSSVWYTCLTGVQCPSPYTSVTFDVLCQGNCGNTSVCKQSIYCPQAPPQAQNRSCTSDSQCNDHNVFGPICNPPLTPDAYAGMSCNTSTGECVQNCTPTGCGTATCTCIDNFTQSCTNSCGTSTSSTNNCNSCNGVTPLAPVINSTPTANCSTKDLYVDWNSVSCANYYYLTYTNNAGHSVTVTDTGNRNDWDIKPTPGTTYTFQVHGVNAISTPIPGPNSAAVNFAIPVPACGPFSTQYSQTPQQTGPINLSIGQTTTAGDRWKNDFWVSVWTSIVDGIGPGINPNAANGGSEGADGRADIRWYGLTQGAGSTWGGSFETGNHPTGTTGHFNADSWAIGCFGNTSCGNIDIARVSKSASVAVKDDSGVAKTSFSSTEDIFLSATGNAAVIPGRDNVKVSLERQDSRYLYDANPALALTGVYNVIAQVGNTYTYAFTANQCTSTNGVSCSTGDIRIPAGSLPAGDYFVHVGMPAFYGAESANTTCTGYPFAAAGTTRCSATGADRVAFTVRPAVAPSFDKLEILNRDLDPVVAQTVNGASKNHLCQSDFQLDSVLDPTLRSPAIRINILDGDSDTSSRGISKLYVRLAEVGSESTNYWEMREDYNKITGIWTNSLYGAGQYPALYQFLGHVDDPDDTSVPGKTLYSFVFRPFYQGDNYRHAEFKISVYTVDVDGLPLSAVGDGFVDVGRSFKVWDCKVNVTGALYDATGSVGLGKLADDNDPAWTNLYEKDKNGTPDMISMNYSGIPVTFLGINENTYPHMEPVSLAWGVVYTPQIIYKNMVDPLTNFIKTMAIGVGNSYASNTFNFSDSGAWNTAFTPYNANGNLEARYTTATFDGWYQIKGSGANASGNLLDNIPSTCTTANSCVPALSVTVGTQDDGLISSTTFDKTFEHLEEVTTDARLWSVRKNLILSKPTYDSLYNDFFVKRGTGGTIVATGGVVNLTGKTGLIFVKGTNDITINADFTPSAFFMLAAKGNINIEGNVKNLNGVYFAGGNINIGGTNTVGLNIKGVVRAGGDVVVTRSMVETDAKGVLVMNNDHSPAVTFEYDPGLLFNTPKELNSSLGVWLETAQ